MARQYFQILTTNETIFDGKHKLDSGVSTAKQGNLVKLASDGELELCDASTQPYGVLYRGVSRDILKPSYDYAASDDKFRAGAYVTCAQGKGKFQADKNCFVGATLPAVGDTIYAAASGLMDTSGTVKIGTCEAVDTVQAPWLSSTSVARVNFDIAAF